MHTNIKYNDNSHILHTVHMSHAMDSLNANLNEYEWFNEVN